MPARFSKPLLEPSGLLPSASISRRQRVVEALGYLLDTLRVVHVRGTPSSGKTTLADLTHKYLQSRRERVFLVKNFDEAAQPVSLPSSMIGVHPVSLAHTPCTVVFDEAQAT